MPNLVRRSDATLTYCQHLRVCAIASALLQARIPCDAISDVRHGGSRLQATRHYPTPTKRALHECPTFKRAGRRRLGLFGVGRLEAMNNGC